jgi:predicted RNase H-like HicB family nuclease
MLLNAIIEKDEDGYFAYVPELKGCMTQGHTYEEVLSNIKEAAELYMECLESDEVSTIQAKNTIIAPFEVLLHG